MYAENESMGSKNTDDVDKLLRQLVRNNRAKTYARIFWNWTFERVAILFNKQSADNKDIIDYFEFEPASVSRGKSQGELSIQSILDVILKLDVPLQNLPILPKKNILDLQVLRYLMPNFSCWVLQNKFGTELPALHFLEICYLISVVRMPGNLALAKATSDIKKRETYLISLQQSAQTIYNQYQQIVPNDPELPHQFVLWDLEAIINLHEKWIKTWLNWSKYVSSLPNFPWPEKSWLN